MPWATADLMEVREEFVQLAAQQGVAFGEHCRRFGISRPTGYKWRRRYAVEGAAGLQDRSRQPHRSPGQTRPELEAAVLALRDQHPAWGGRKLAARLRALGQAEVPAPSTITAILRRHGRLAPASAGRPRAWQRFEHPYPNALWQMDFKGRVPCGGAWCLPLTVLDDHSRYAVALVACPDQQTETVQASLTAAFQHYGLPDRLLVDNGAPWGDSWEQRYTRLTVWLLRLGVPVSHARPYHPQTLGKDERFHGTLQRELLVGPPFPDLAHSQQAFDRWRAVYNHQRPHEALGDAVPASRYRPSARPFPASLPPIDYGPADAVRKVQHRGWVSFQGRPFRLPKAFRGYSVAFRPTRQDGVWDIFFGAQRLARVDLRQALPTLKRVNHVPEHL